MISVVIPVYRDACNAIALIDALQKQKLVDNDEFEIVVVDDGSDDDSPVILRERESKSVRILISPINQGRAGARNLGAELARGDRLVFLDCDCRPVNEDFLQQHLYAFQECIVASCGPLTGRGKDFWSRYQDEVSLRRSRLHRSGATYVGSTANFMIRSSVFHDVGGFDTRYRAYGFEDRDLIVRLSKVGEIAWSQKAVVQHLDYLTLAQVTTKMGIAAGKSAMIFLSDHPEAYRRLGYAMLDVRLHAWLFPVCVVLRPLLKTIPIAERLIKYKWVPYLLAKTLVKMYTALAYVSGSAEIR